MKYVAAPACFEYVDLFGDFDVTAVLMECALSVCDDDPVTSLVVVLVTGCGDLRVAAD